MDVERKRTNSTATNNEKGDGCLRRAATASLPVTDSQLVTCDA